MHFYESSLITTKDCLHCQVYGNEHPKTAILVKPKYIPTDKIESSIFESRFISGRKMNRLDMWVDKTKLKNYIEEFKKKYPKYIFQSDIHDKEKLFFAVPIDEIERIYSPRRGISELMKISKNSLDPHLKLVVQLVEFLLESGIRLEDFGITYSSLVGHYFSKISDINLVVYGKENFWKLMKFLETAQHPLLKWKTREEWMDFYKKRNRFNIFNEDEFFRIMSRKKSEGFFGDSLFVIFGAEKENEVWFKWGEEKYLEKGTASVEGTVTDNYNSIVRPGFYEIKDSKIIEGYENVPVKRIVFYSRDYALIAFPEERIRAHGVLEEVKPKNKQPYYRIVVGYFDSYISDKREKEYIKLISSEQHSPKQFNKFAKEECALCKESLLEVGQTTDYGAVVIYKIGNDENTWFATLSPKTGGHIEKDFSIQLMPAVHLTNFSQIHNYPKLAENYGLAFSKLNFAVSKIIEEQNTKHDNKQDTQQDNNLIPMGVYGKCKHLDEHIHIKIFPYRGDIGQPFTLDSSFERKPIHTDSNKEKFVKMKPIQKTPLPKERFNYLSGKLISLLK